VFSIFRRLLGVALVGAAGFVVFAAGLLQEFSGDEIPKAAIDAGVSLPLSDPNVYVSTRRGVLELRDGDVVVKLYDCGFGRSSGFARLGRGEASTPLGEYKIVAKERRKDVANRGSRFLRFDYPTEDDLRRALFAGVVTDEELPFVRASIMEGGPPPPVAALGGPIGIQGGYYFFTARHFTDGSIALSNADVNELYDYLPEGCRVVVGD
jgi:hypothetical protein